MHASRLALPLLLTLTFTLAACSAAGIALKEKFGYAKREQLVDEVKDARSAQEAAKVQFASALDEFLSATQVQTGELESTYRRLRGAYDRSQERANRVRARITDVERVATALFREWQEELKEFSSDSTRRASERQLDATRREYDRLYDSMKAAEAKMDPVLGAFNDQVLYLKHNLNARAIAGLRDESATIQRDVADLLREMEASIAESDAFIRRMLDEPEAG